MKINVKKNKKIKGIPKEELTDHPFKGSLDQEITDLRKKNVPYFEIVSPEGDKTVFQKAPGQQNYSKKLFLAKKPKKA